MLICYYGSYVILRFPLVFVLGVTQACISCFVLFENDYTLRNCTLITGSVKLLVDLHPTYVIRCYVCATRSALTHSVAPRMAAGSHSLCSNTVLGEA